MRKLFALGLVMALGGWSCVTMDGNGNGTPTPTPTASPTPTPTPTPTPGPDAAAGKSFYDASCAACHAADASGNIGPNIQGFSAAQTQTGVEGAPGPHGSITIGDEDYANLGAYLETLP